VVQRMFTIGVVAVLAAGCGAGFASLKPESIEKLEVRAASTKGVCGHARAQVGVVVEVFTKDGKRLLSAPKGGVTEGRLDPATFVYKANVGKMDRGGVLTLPDNPLTLLQPVEVTAHHKASATPVGRATVPIRFDCEASAHYAGAGGAAGSEKYQYYGTGAAAPSGYAGAAGGHGGNGGNGAAVEVRIGWMTTDDGRRLAIAGASDGSRREYYVIDPEGPGLVVNVSGGAGGNGGRGQPGATSGNFEQPGTSGGYGGNGGDGGSAGTVTVLAEDAALHQLVHIIAEPGAAGAGGEGGPGGPESETAGGGPLAGGPAGESGGPGNPGRAGGQARLQIIASPTAALIAEAGGAPATTTGGAVAATDRKPVRSTPDVASPGKSPAPGKPTPAAPRNKDAPWAFSGAMTVTMTVLEPSRAKPASSTATATARLVKTGGKNRLEFEANCGFELAGAKGTIKGGACDNGPLVLSGLRGPYEISTTAVSFTLKGKFAFKPNKQGEKVAKGDVTVTFRGDSQ
jgi:hypothetical protein